MCLTIVREEFEPPINAEVMAWKEVRVENDRPYSPCHAYELKWNDWATAAYDNCISYVDKKNGGTGFYQGGFHVYADQALAETVFADNQHNRKFFELPLNVVLIRVMVRGVTVRGVEFSKIGGRYRFATVLVAREIYCFPVEKPEEFAELGNWMELRAKELMHQPRLAVSPCGLTAATAMRG
jgi:hypothetical protein